MVYNYTIFKYLFLKICKKNQYIFVFKIWHQITRVYRNWAVLVDRSDIRFHLDPAPWCSMWSHMEAAVSQKPYDVVLKTSTYCIDMCQQVPSVVIHFNKLKISSDIETVSISIFILWQLVSHLPLFELSKLSYV